jgi:four helix bundle protein
MPDAWVIGAGCGQIAITPESNFQLTRRSLPRRWRNNGRAGRLASALLVMDVDDWSIKDKPFDLRERLFNFACVITRIAQFLHTRGPIAVAVCAQVLRSGTSAGANFEEAEDGSSPRDVRAKRRIVLRELKETSFRLRVLRNTGILTPAHDPVINECAEL